MQRYFGRRRRSTLKTNGGQALIRQSAAMEALEIRRLLSTTWYVDAAANGPTHDGSSWSSAYTDLQQALGSASAGDAIHVAQGSYKPTSTTDRTISFQLKSGVEIDGGYAGSTSATPDARDVEAYPTILSGDIGTPGDNADNSYHVVNGSYVDSTAMLAGVTITGGNVDLASNGNGGGMTNIQGNPTIEDCTFSDNVASNRGGGIYNDFSIPKLIHCTFSHNTADQGGAVFNGSVASDTPIIFDDCDFRDNSGRSGAGVFNNACGIELSGCAFRRNLSQGEGGGMYSYFSTLTLENCTFTGNRASLAKQGVYGGGATSVFDSSADIRSCTFIGNSAFDGGAISCFNASDVTVMDCVFNVNVAREFGAGAYSYLSSPTIANCIFAANMAEAGATSASYRSTTILVNCVLFDESISPAAPELYAVDDDGQHQITYSDIQGGYAGTGNIDADPLFYRNPSPGADGTWGTADDDYGDLRLLPNSPCIDAGSNSDVPAGVTTDIAGNPRIFDFPGVKAAGAIVDMGAYEANTNLGAMHLTSGQNVILPPGHHTFSVTQLTIDPGATLDLEDDSLVIDYTGTSPLGSWDSGASAYTGINGGIESGAIFSSVAQSKYTTLAATEASDILGLTGSATTTWGGQTVDSTAVLIKFTYAGDANLDGKVNIDDYGRIDGNVGQSGQVFGWYNGDFNYDGKIDIDDYGLIDSVIGTQGGIL